MSHRSLTNDVTSLRRPTTQVWLDSSGIPSPPSPHLPAMHKLVEAAILAPSPDNNQPWQFVAGPDYLDVHLDLARSLPSDVDHMFDLTAIGAAVENLCIASREQGFEPQVEMLSRDKAFDDNDTRQTTGAIPVARVRWVPGAKKDRLHAPMPNRHTDRHGYSTKPLDPAILAELSAEVEKFPGIHIRWLAYRREIWRFAWLVGKSDRMRFEKKIFHEELYKQIRFTAQEAEATGSGLDVRTLALPPGGTLVLKALRSWRLLALLNRLGASRMLALPSVPQVVRSAAVGIILADAPGKGYVDGGRALERLWLTATQLGLALHPLGSLPIYVQRESNASATNLKRKAAELVAPKAPSRIQIAFRIGLPK